MWAFLFLLLQTLFSGRGDPRLELPESRRDPDCIVINHIGYTTCFNRKEGIPEWVAYELKTEELTKNYARQKGYYPDPMLLEEEQPASWQYRNENGTWVRGHMAPAGDMVWDEEALIESNYMTNLCPQHYVMNNGDWRRLEEKIRKLSKKLYPRMWIVCGTVVKENRNGRLSDRVTVPDSLYKAILAQRGDDYITIGFIFPNDSVYRQLKEYAVTVDQLEVRIGLDLFHNLKPRYQRKSEAVFNLRDWEL